MKHQLTAIALLYLAASLVQTPVSPSLLSDPYARVFGKISLAPPMVLSGDSPHYLASVHSIIEDRDWDLGNNYRQAAEGDWDLGNRFRAREIDHHTDKDKRGRELGIHSPFFALLLALLVWPFGSSRWVEPACILWMIAFGLGVIYLTRRLATQLGGAQAGLLASTALALATPLWCYSRDIWTEPLTALLWLALLIGSRSLLGLGVLAFLGVLIKYPFAVVPLTMGLLAFWRGDRKRGLVFMASAAAGLVVAILTIQFLFRDVAHFSLLHSGSHLAFDLPFDGMIGLLIAPRHGLLMFFPFLLWGIWALRRRLEIALPLLAFFLVHASYQDWPGGTGLANRYMTPLVPLLLIALAADWPKSRLFKIALGYSLFWGCVAGIFPALVYERGPWQVLVHVYSRL